MSHSRLACVAAFYLASACAQPTTELAEDEPSSSAPETTPASEEEPAVPAAELSGEQVASYGSVEEAIANYRGPRVSVVPNLERVEAGVPFVVSASLQDAEGVTIPLDATMTFAWGVPEGWDIGGEGAEVTVVPAVELPPGADPIEVRVAVERGGSPLVRGGVMLNR